ncbi:MAG: stage III sporulation protein AB [Lachnospiraceae bacterium]
MAEMVGIILVLLASALYGRNYAMLLQLRVKEIEEWIRLLHYMEGQLSYSLMPLPVILAHAKDFSYHREGAEIAELLATLSEDMPESSFSRIWSEAMLQLKQRSHLKEEDIATLASLAKGLGSMDKQMSLSNLALCIKRMEWQLEEAIRCKKEKTKLGYTVCMAVGALLVVILI